MIEQGILDRNASPYVPCHAIGYSRRIYTIFKFLSLCPSCLSRLYFIMFLVQPFSVQCQEQLEAASRSLLSHYARISESACTSTGLNQLLQFQALLSVKFSEDVVALTIEL